MTDNKKLSQSSQEQFFNFFDASISPIQFEKWLFENPEVESCLGPEKYCALLSLSYHRKESISNVERLAETHLDIDKFYGPKIVLILERFIKSEWNGTSQLTSFLKVMDEIEEMYWKCPESLQEMFEDLLDREGAYQGLESRLESLSVDDEKWLILAFKKTVTASQRALYRIKEHLKV